MQITIEEKRPIQYGVQLEIRAADQRVTADFYSESKHKKLVFRPGGDPAFMALLAAQADTLREALLAGPGPWTVALAPGGQKSVRDEFAGIRIWSDGGSKPNPGPGGYGVLVRYPDGRERELSGYERMTTNNRMELSGVIRGLEAVAGEGGERQVTVDSTYVMKGITSWIKGWQAKGWKTATGAPVQNRDLWEALVRLAAERPVQWHWVRGHAGHAENERCDRLATEARERRAGVDRYREG